MPTLSQQYDNLKAQQPDAVLLFRVGDFYECFRDDAAAASKTLGLTLTRRSEMPMCGFPYHQLDGYLARLVKSGFRVAVCERAA